MRALSNCSVDPLKLVGGLAPLLGLVGLLVLAGCGEKAPQALYTVKGIVRAIGLPPGTVTIQHEAIPGYMAAMTMPLMVKEASLLEGLVPGEEVQFRLVVFPDRAYVDRLVVTKPLMANQQAKPVPPNNAARLHLPALGEPIPEVSLINQDGKPVRLADYRGKILAMTFVYSQCPLSTYCPRAMQEFQLLQRLLEKHAGTDVQLFTMSFDPKRDSPEVLRRYGSAYGVDGQAWQLLTGEPEQIEQVVSYFNVALWKKPNGAIESHTMSAAIVDREGRVAEFYAGNRWTAEDLARAIRELLQK